MKKLTVFLAFFAIAFTIKAQNRKDLGLESYWEIKGGPTDPKNKNINIVLEVKKDALNGETLFFNSNIALSKVVFVFIDVQDKLEGLDKLPRTMNLKKHNYKSYFFYLESGSYKPGLIQGYKIEFYTKRSKGPIWQGTVIKKQKRRL